MDDLADAVGISKATLYQHFGSKDEMLIALIHEHTARFGEWLTTTADQPPLVRLRETMRYLMEGHITPLRGLIQFGREDILPVFEGSADLISQHTETLAMLSAIVREGQADGSIVHDLAPQIVISAMWALSNVSMAEHKPAHGDAIPLDREVYITQMLSLFERSITPPVR